MRALLCGVRGSTPVSGAEYLGVGGATSCVAIPAADGRWLVLDAGTGFTRLAEELGDTPLRGSLLLTHLHWDHIHGLPFLANADRADAEIDVWLPSDEDDCDGAEALLARGMSPPHFPISPSGLHGRWRFSTIAAGVNHVEGFTVGAAPVHHKGGPTLGFRVSSPSGSLAYVPDHAPRLASSDERAAAVALVAGVDVLLHGGGFRAGERAQADAYGHATIDDAVDFAGEAGVGRLVIVHHRPARTDDELADIETSLRSCRSVDASIGRAGDWVQALASADTTGSGRLA